MIYPEYIELKHWANQMVNDYPAEFLPILQKEEDWQEWGSIVVASGRFSRLNLPPPTIIYQNKRKGQFKDWKEWAKVVYTIITNESIIEGRNV